MRLAVFLAVSDELQQPGSVESQHLRLILITELAIAYLGQGIQEVRSSDVSAPDETVGSQKTDALLDVAVVGDRAAAVRVYGGYVADSADTPPIVTAYVCHDQLKLRVAPAYLGAVDAIGLPAQIAGHLVPGVLDHRHISRDGLFDDRLEALVGDDGCDLQLDTACATIEAPLDLVNSCLPQIWVCVDEGDEVLRLPFICAKSQIVAALHDLQAVAAVADRLMDDQIVNADPSRLPHQLPRILPVLIIMYMSVKIYEHGFHFLHAVGRSHRFLHQFGLLLLAPAFAFVTFPLLGFTPQLFFMLAHLLSSLAELHLTQHLVDPTGGC